MLDFEVLKEAIDNGKYLGQGISRIAFAISDKVVAKKCNNYSGQQTFNEIEFYERFYDDYQHLMPEMYGYFDIYGNGHPVLFMERVVPIEEMYVYEYLSNEYGFDSDEYNRYADIIDEFEAYTGIGDSSENSNNWGVRANGDLVILDCGWNENCNQWYDSDYEYDDDYPYLCSPPEWYKQAG